MLWAILAIGAFFSVAPRGELNLRAQNLVIFVQIAKGIDDETWNYHLRHGQYWAWFRDVLKDPDLADTASSIEQSEGLAASDSRGEISHAISRKYTAPDNAGANESDRG